MVRVSNDVAELLIKQKFEKLTNGCKISSDWDVLIEHFGEVNAAAISKLSISIENKISSDSYSKSTKKKAFAILIEGLQNIYRHAVPNEDGEAVGAFALLDNSSSVQLHFFNLINQDAIKGMNDFCQQLDTLSLDKLKYLYMKTLGNTDMTEKGGASLGCMLMKLKSDGNLKYAFESVDSDLSCFHLIVTVNK
jgi:hypothetical protein|tara:strand:+ start:22368 stop:22946 length:579 start_codon:yes stop_codon:yes gene_type:complete